MNLSSLSSRFSFLLAACFWISLTLGHIASAQTGGISWDRHHPVPDSVGPHWNVEHSITLENGHFLILGGRSDTASAPFWPKEHLMEIDEYGRIVKEAILADTNLRSFQRLIPLKDQGFAIFSYEGYKMRLTGFDSTWTLQFQKRYNRDLWKGYWDIRRTSDEGFMLSGDRIMNGVFGVSFTPTYKQAALKLDSIGNVVWDSVFAGVSGNNRFGDMLELPSGNLIALGSSIDVNSQYFPTLTRLQPNGAQIATSLLSRHGIELPNGNRTSLSSRMEMTGNFELVVVSRDSLWGPNWESGILMSRYDTNGTLLNRKNYLWPNSSLQTKDLVLFKDGSGAIWYEEVLMPSWQYQYGFLIFDANGDSVGHWKIPPYFGMDDFVALDSTAGHGYMLVGNGNTGGPGGLPRSLRMDSLGNLNINHVSGRVFYDQNGNCMWDPQEPLLPYGLVEATPSPAFSLTDPTGRYHLLLDSGQHALSLPNFPLPYQVNCGAGAALNLYLPNQNDTLDTLDIPIGGMLPCPVLNVDMTMLTARICANNTIRVNYQNFGGDTATGAYMIIDLDTSLSLVSASVPYIQTGPNQLQINLGTIPPFGAGSFSLVVTVDCNTVLRESLCSSAHIYPDTNCLPPNPLWNGASLALQGDCLPSDSVRFRLTNVGTNSMAGPSGIIVVEDDVLSLMDTVTLTAGSDTSYLFQGNGSTWAMFAQQVPFHPGNSIPRVFVEGCGVDSSGRFSVGHVVSHLPDDHVLFLDIECQEATGPYDPNDKTGFPLGVGPQHGILANQPLEYRIRFQNTGTDTAYKVVVRDRIPLEFDLSSFQMLNTSHLPYTVEFFPDNVIEWTFDKIMLPDSNVDLLGSQGFLKFELAQDSANPLGTRIENNAEIFFDYNVAVVTNTTFHTVYEEMLGDLIQVSIDEPATPLHTGIGLKVYPNPFRDKTRFELDQSPKGPLTLELFDLQGRLRKTMHFPPLRSFELHREQIPGGVQLFRLTDGYHILKTGRLLASPD